MTKLNKFLRTVQAPQPKQNTAIYHGNDSPPYIYGTGTLTRKTSTRNSGLRFPGK